jgi:ribosomal protein S18 acetylase RimI-like enzyme
MTTTTDGIDIDDIALPAGVDLAGITFRHYRGLDDLPGMADSADAASRAAGSVETRSLDAMLAQYRNLDNCDPDQDIVVVEADGRTVAYQRTWWGNRNEGSRGFECVSFIDPAYAGRGIEDALLAIGERRQVALARTMPADGRPTFLARFVRGTDPAAVARLEAAGFRQTRRYAELARPDFEAIPDFVAPDGIELRRIDPAEAGDPAILRRAWEVATEAFIDSYGERGASEVEFRHFTESPECRPELWCVAFDVASGEVAGQILNYLGEPAEDGAIVGWTESIAVREPWRRRGIASAMLAESLRIVRDAGATSAALGVDQENPNEAKTLYERLGFRVTMEELEFQKAIDLEGAGR